MSATPHPSPARATLVVTGAAGYVGGNVVRAALADPRVGVVVGIDTNPPPPDVSQHPHLTWVRASVEGNEWQRVVAPLKPTALIHAAWRVRCRYGRGAAEDWANNVGGTRMVARWVLTQRSVRAVVFVSSAAVFAAGAHRSASYPLSPLDVPDEHIYPYGVQKRAAERLLASLWLRHRSRRTLPRLRIARPVSVIGPRATARKDPFLLTAIAAGRATPAPHPLARIAQVLMTVMPAPSTWARQYIHEDDAVAALLALALEAGPSLPRGEAEIYHLAGDGVVGVREFCALARRHWVPVPPQLVRAAFAFMWHVSRGVVPTAPGSWRFYAYPVVLEGAAITEHFSFRYRATSREALRAYLTDSH